MTFEHAYAIHQGISHARQIAAWRERAPHMLAPSPELLAEALDYGCACPIHRRFMTAMEIAEDTCFDCAGESLA